MDPATAAQGKIGGGGGIFSSIPVDSSESNKALGTAMESNIGAAEGVAVAGYNNEQWFTTARPAAAIPDGLIISRRCN
jgi:hypothetical protein